MKCINVKTEEVTTIKTERKHLAQKSAREVRELKKKYGSLLNYLDYLNLKVKKECEQKQ